MTGRDLILLLVVLVAVSGSEVVVAEPFVPKDDTQVLEHLRFKPADPRARELRQMRAEIERNPRNLELALRLARRYIEQGRAEADPRYNGYAQAVLGPWWGLPVPPPEILVLRATIRQSGHDFESALADLLLALKADPGNPQAWVTRALILQIRGDYSEAKRNCLPLKRLSTELVALTCLSGVASLNGQASKSHDLLRNSLDRTTDAPPGERLWALTVLAEIAARTGQTQAAEEEFKRAFALGLRDSYLLGTYADYLLDQGRPAEVIRLLKDETRADGLLLRLALAEQSLRAPNLYEHVEVLRTRFQASRLRGDTVHRREEARFTLKLLNKPHEALTLAQANWAVQREPWDARIFLESALAANDTASAQPVLQWLKQTGLEDRHLSRFSKQLKGERP